MDRNTTHSWPKPDTDCATADQYAGSAHEYASGLYWLGAESNGLGGVGLPNLNHRCTSQCPGWQYGYAL